MFEHLYERLNDSAPPCINPAYFLLSSEDSSFPTFCGVCKVTCPLLDTIVALVTYLLRRKKKRAINE